MKRVFTLILLFSIPHFLHPWPTTISHMKDSYTCLQPKYQHLSPLHGATWTIKNITKNYYMLGNIELEFNNDDLVTKIGNGDATIRLIHYLFYLNGDTFNVSQSDRYSAQKFTGTTIGLLMLLLEQYARKTYADRNTFVNESVKRMYQALGTREGKKRGVRKVVCAVFDSYDEVHAEKYSRFTTHNILLSFLYMRVDEREYSSYFAQLTELDTSGILQYPFPPGSMFDDTNPRDFESMICQSLNERISIVAAMCHTHHIFGGTRVTFPDCMETAIRNFINFLLYNPRRRIYDLARIPQKFHESVRRSLVSFYVLFDTVWSGKSDDAHVAWASLIVNHTECGIDYFHDHEPICDIGYAHCRTRARLSNLVCAFSYLFGYPFSGINEICVLFGLTYEQLSEKIEDHNAILLFKRNGNPLFKLIIKPRHAEVIPVMTTPLFTINNADAFYALDYTDMQHIYFLQPMNDPDNLRALLESVCDPRNPHREAFAWLAKNLARELGFMG